MLVTTTTDGHDGSTEPITTALIGTPKFRIRERFIKKKRKKKLIKISFALTRTYVQ